MNLLQNKARVLEISCKLSWMSQKLWELWTLLKTHPKLSRKIRMEWWLWKCKSMKISVESNLTLETNLIQLKLKKISSRCKRKRQMWSSLKRRRRKTRVAKLLISMTHKPWWALKKSKTLKTLKTWWTSTHKTWWEPKTLSNQKRSLIRSNLKFPRMRRKSCIHSWCQKKQRSNLLLNLLKTISLKSRCKRLSTLLSLRSSTNSNLVRTRRRFWWSSWEKIWKILLLKFDLPS